MAQGVAGEHRSMRWLFFVAALGWLIFAIAFKLVPTGIDGILEKIGIGATLLWTIPLSILFLKRGLRHMQDDGDSTAHRG